jgi:hypothetical protein
MKKYTIWSNYNLDLADWDGCRDGWEELTDAQRWEYVSWLNEEYLNDERANLQIGLPEDIIVIADLGLWNGRRCGYKELNHNIIGDALYDSTCYYMEWYCDMYDLHFKGAHHDGANHYLYRYWKPGTSEAQRENFLEKLYNGTATKRDITRYTCSLRPAIAAVYGWKGGRIR